jgi:hypothetical protein
MVKPVSDGSEYTRGYQQALIDFGWHHATAVGYPQVLGCRF